MLKFIGRRFTSAHVLAMIALFVALTGTTFAAATALAPNSVGARQLKRNAVTNPKIRGNAVTSNKVRNNTLTGADIRESSLGRVPLAAEADDVPNATFGRSTATVAGNGTSSSCNPTTAAFIDCGTVTLSLPRAGRVLIIADAAFHGENTLAYRGDCRLTVDGTQIGSTVSAGSVQVGAAISGPGFNGNAEAGIGLNAVTEVLNAGTHQLALQCNQAGGTVAFDQTFVSAVMIGAG